MCPRAAANPMGGDTGQCPPEPLHKHTHPVTSAHRLLLKSCKKISSKPLLSLASPEMSHVGNEGGDDPARSSNRERHGARSPGKPGCFWHSPGVGCPPGVCQAGKDELCHHLCPSSCFSGSALGHQSVPKKRAETGTAKMGFKDDFCVWRGKI